MKKEEMILYGGDLSGTVVTTNDAPDTFNSKLGTYHKTELKTQFGRIVYLFDYEGWNTKD